MPTTTTTPRPVLIALTTGSRGEDVNLYTDLMAAAVHDEGATLRTGGHTYTVEALTAPHGAPDDGTKTVPASRARGIALADVYASALLDLRDVGTTAQIASMVVDLLHLADAQGDSAARDVLDLAREHYESDTDSTD